MAKVRLKSRQRTKKRKPSELRSRIMRAIKSSGTRPELIVGNWLRSIRANFIEHDQSLPGRPDFSLKGKKIAVFVHGCFWHGHRCKRGNRKPKSNRSYWSAKLAANRLRDSRSKRQLNRMGWGVVTLWECSIAEGRARRRLVNYLSR